MCSTDLGIPSMVSDRTVCCASFRQSYGERHSRDHSSKIFHRLLRKRPKVSHNRRRSVSLQHYGLSDGHSKFLEYYQKRKRKRWSRHRICPALDSCRVKRYSLSRHTNSRRRLLKYRLSRSSDDFSFSRRNSFSLEKALRHDHNVRYHAPHHYHRRQSSPSSSGSQKTKIVPRYFLNKYRSSPGYSAKYKKKSVSSISSPLLHRPLRQNCSPFNERALYCTKKHACFMGSAPVSNITSESQLKKRRKRRESYSEKKERCKYIRPCALCRCRSSSEVHALNVKDRVRKSRSRTLVKKKHKHQVHRSSEYPAERHRERSLTYFSHSSRHANNPPSDSDIIHFNWYPGMNLGRRFRVERKLGEGTFGRVLECIDLRYNTLVAVKVVRDVSRYTRSAKIEADILKDIKAMDPERRSNCVMLVDQYLYNAWHRRSCTSASAMRPRKKCHRHRRRHSCHRSCMCSKMSCTATSRMSPPQKKGEPHSQRTNQSSDEHSANDRSSSSHVNEYAKGVHMCLASEKLGLSLYAFLTQNKYHGFFVADIRRVAYETLKALSFLRKLKLTHTDLKPENILFIHNGYERVPHPRSCYPPRFWNGDCSDSELDESLTRNVLTDRQRYRSSHRTSERKMHNREKRYIKRFSHRPLVMTKRPLDSRVKLIDFGSATYEDDEHTSVINTRQYRAPEVIFQIGWSTPSDMWCLGCILVELYTGVLLFRTHEHFEHLAMIEKIVCPFSQTVLRAVAHSPTAHYIAPRSHPDEEYRLDWPRKASSEKSIEKVAKCRRLESMFLPCHKLLADFVKFILVPDPNLRPTPKEALAHPFINTSLPEA